MRSSRRADTILAWSLRGSAVASGVVALVIAVFLVRESVPAVRSIGLDRFVTDPGWHPAAEAAGGGFNLLPMLVGTLLVTAGAVLLAAPLGVLSGVFCHHIAPPVVAGLYRRLVELLAGVPSVIYGLWGLVVLVPLVRELHPPGPSLLAGVLVLAIMTFPTVALLADVAIGGVPRSQLRAAAALGLTRWGTVRHVVLPAAGGGIASGVILQTARALGETMAVLMVCGNIVQIPRSPFEPFRALTANIALEMGYAAGDHRAALFLSGLVLLGLVVGLVALASWFERGGAFAPPVAA